MLKDHLIELLTKKDKNKKKSKIPAKLDLFQSITGLILVVFIMFHLIFESSILLGKDAMYTLTKAFELSFIFEGGEPLVISILAFIVFVIFIVHAFLAMRKFPSSYRQYFSYTIHAKMLKHEDTNLWLLQISTGFIMFFLGSVHLYTMMSQPENIGPFASADRFYSDVAWPMYLMLLISVVLHASVGLYRLIVKWGWIDRKKSKIIIQIATVFYLTIGLFSLVTYMKIGYEHQDEYGKRYVVDEKK